MTSSRLGSMGIVLLAGALYGVLNTLTIGLSLPGSDVAVGIRPQVVIPMLGGFLMGPAHGFVIGCGGNFLGDWLNGLGLGFWPFSLGNGLMGMIPGLVYFWGGPRVNNVSRFAVLLVLIVAGTTLGMGSGVLVYQFLVQDSLQILTWTFFHPMIVANVICAFILFPPLLFFFKKISSTFDINLGAFLMYLLMCVVAVLVFSLNLINSQTIKRELAGALPDNVLGSYMETAASDGFRYGGSIGIVAILISVGLTFALIQYLARPVRTLIDAAGQLKEGRLDRINLEALMEKNDEFGRLAQVFSDAVEQVRSREKSMQQAIKELRLEIDRDQEARQVKEITETDYFQSLRHRSLELRARKEKIRNEKNRH